MIYFTSDQHFGHQNVIKYCSRPFRDAHEMNEQMVTWHNEIVKPGDTVYHLGDFSMSKSCARAYLPRLNGEHHLIAGNHDACHPVHYKKEPKGEAMRQLYLDFGFKTICLEKKFQIHPGAEVLMAHMPYTGDRGDRERYVQYRPKNDGLWLLHGHVHDHWKIKEKMLNVGVDVWNFRPVSIDQIKELILA